MVAPGDSCSRAREMLMRHDRRRQSGQVAILFALGLVALVALVGLAVDGGQAYVDRSALQSGVDNAAEAGTQMLYYNQIQCDQNWSAPCPYTYTDSDVAAAVAAGLYGSSAGGSKVSSPYTAYYTNVDGSLLESAGIPIAVGSLGGVSPPPGAYGVKVTAGDQQATYLLGLIGIGHSHPSATATAVYGQVAGCAFGPACAPFAIWYQNCTTSPASDWVADPGYLDPYTPGASAPAASTATFYSNAASGSWPDCPGVTGSTDFTGHIHNPSGPLVYNQTFVTDGGVVHNSATMNALQASYLTGTPIIVPEVNYVPSCAVNAGQPCLQVTGFAAIVPTCDPAGGAGHCPSSVAWTGVITGLGDTPLDVGGEGVVLGQVTCTPATQSTCQPLLVQLLQ